MNNLKKVGLTALATSLITTSAFAGAVSVTGSASINLANQSNSTQSNGFSSGDSLNFSGSGELDNGMTVTMKQEIDGGVMDDRSVAIEMDGMGKLTINNHGGSTAMSAVDDTTPTAYGESWDVIGHTSASSSLTTGQTSKEGAIGGFSSNTNFFYDVQAMIEGLDINVSFTPSTSARQDGSISYDLAYKRV